MNNPANHRSAHILLRRARRFFSAVLYHSRNQATTAGNCLQRFSGSRGTPSRPFGRAAKAPSSRLSSRRARQERLKEEARTSHAEYEGLKELYQRKNREFDEYKEGAEQDFARDQAIQRHNLENEIRDNRQANQDYVSSTVKTFGESYNYYLNQIKVLMDALGDVATRTGAALFSGENGDLKSRFGAQMRDVLKSGADSLKGDDGDLILIGTAD